MRVPTPWIDALNAKRAGKTIEDPDGLGTVSAKPGELTPKHMSESYVKVVLPLNSQGNVR